MKKTYWKDILQAFTKSKGRFISIMSLMALGAFALIGLKVTGPNMQRTAQTFFEAHQVMDLAVMADYGLDADDVKELESLSDTQVELGYLTDVTVKGTTKALRLQSASKDISAYILTEGKMPAEQNEIALSFTDADSYQVGDHITVVERADRADKQVLATHSFTITGFVKSSEIWSESNLGGSTAGSGNLSSYAVVDISAFESEVYMIARLRFGDLRDQPYYSKTYKSRLKAHQRELEELLEDNGQVRLATLVDEANVKIADGEKKLVAGKAKLTSAASDIATGQAQMSSGAQELASAKASLSQTQTQLSEAANQLASGQATLSETKTKLEAAKSQLDASKAQLDSSKAILAASKQQLDAAQATLDSKKAELNKAKSQLDTAKASLDSRTAELSSAKAQLDTAKSQLDSTKAKLATSQAQLEAEQAQLASSQSALEKQKASLQAQGLDPASNAELMAAQAVLESQAAQLATSQLAYEAGLAQYQAGQAEYETKFAAYTAGQSQLAAGQVEYERQKAAYDAGLAQYTAGKAEYDENAASYVAGFSQYQAGEAQYQSGLKTYQAGLAQYQAGLAEFNQNSVTYQSGMIAASSGAAELSQKEAELETAASELKSAQATYESEKTKSDKDLSQAEADLTQAKQDVAALRIPTYTLYNRSTLPGGRGFQTYDSATSSIDAVGNIFPVVLYLVAAMVTFTTMTRFVDEERTNAGIFKALGYTNQQVMTKFVLYGLVTGLTGTVMGILLGNYLLSPMIGDILINDMVIDSITLYHYPHFVAAALMAALISAVLPAYLVARRDLSESAAQLLQAKPPVEGATILLERLPLIWQGLSFTHKVTARNIFRYKQRMFMTIFGVAGSVALLFAGLGIRSSISGVSDAQFGQIMTYDLLIAKDSSADKEASADLQAKLKSDDIASYQAIATQTITAELAGEDQQNITLLMTDQAQFDGLDLTDRKSGDKLKLTDQGVIITEKLAKLENVKVGEVMLMPLEDKVHEVKVAGIAQMFAGHFIYMTAAYYEQVTGLSYENNGYLVTLKDQSAKSVNRVSTDFLQLPAVAGLSQNIAQINQLKAVTRSLASVMQILVLAAMLLAVVILYNLTNINVQERIRELSTIKVLGFHNKEVTLYIYRETIILSIIGIVVGLLGGYALHQFLISMVAGNDIMFNPSVPLTVYTIPLVVITVILTLLGLLVNFNLRRIDMLEALKSVE